MRKELVMNQRGQWRRPVEFILSLIGYAVGMSGVWRFPYMALRNGGGAFVVPYSIFVLVVGIPFVTMETALGQYFQLSPLLIFDMCPLFKGVGISMTLVSFLLFLYYLVILAWALYYLVMSMSAVLPWTTCDNAWNTNSCVPIGLLSQNYSNLTTTPANSTYSGRLSTEEFWRYNVLDISSGIDDPGYIRWQLLLALIGSLVLIYACIFKGIESSRIAVYLTATAPLVLLVALLAGLLTRPGSVDGVLYFFTPRWEQLSTYQTWLEAFLHTFYSLGPGWGGLIVLASFNPFHQNCLRDSIIVVVADMLTAFLCGAVVFAGLGCIAYDTGSDVSDVITVGPGLSFITYPQVVASLPVPQLWSACFFLLILLLGLDSEFTMVKMATSGIIDLFPKTMKRYQPAVVLVVLTISLLLALPYVTQGGIYMFQIVDWYCVTFTILVISVCESIAVVWIYGADRFLANVKEMTSSAPSWYLKLLKFSWKFVIPSSMLVVLGIALAKFRPPKYGDYIYPEWTNVFGWMIAASTSIPIPALMIYKLSTTTGTLRQRFTKCCTPLIAGGPPKAKQQSREVEDIAQEEKLVS